MCLYFIKSEGIYFGSKKIGIGSTMDIRVTLLVFSVTLFSKAYSYNDKPNFVIFLADDMGYADLPMYGNPLADTPNINNLADTGMKFSQFYSASSVGSPSRAALLTGRYPVRTGVWNSNPHGSPVFNQSMTGGLSHQEITIPEMLATQGYKSAHIGKWHLGVGVNREFLPLHHGFDRYFGVPHSHSDCPCEKCFYPNEPCDYDDCATQHAPCQLMYDNSILEQPVDLTTLSERYARAARSWIQDYACSETPFFLYYAFQHNHVPQFAGKQFRGSTLGGAYTDSLAEIDWQVGQVIEELENSGLRENTMIIFTSDNGADLIQNINGGFSGQMQCGKGSTFEGGHRVPTIMNWPGHIRINGISVDVLSHLDIWPTLRHISGSLTSSELDVVIDGKDFSDVIFSYRKMKNPSILFFPQYPSPLNGAVGLRLEKYKIQNLDCSHTCANNNGDQTCFARNSHVLYDILLDPEERNDCSNDTDFVSIFHHMTLELTNKSSDVTFSDSVLMEYDESGQLCCNPGCEPFPSCCNCESNYSEDLFPIDVPCTKKSFKGKHSRH